jgi:hypothetical protein
LWRLGRSLAKVRAFIRCHVDTRDHPLLTYH